MAFGWHVAITRPLQEFLAEQQLADQGFQPFNPKVVETRIIRNRHHTIRKPYIPGYIFINFDDEEDRWKSINSTRGVQHLMLATPERPAIVNAQAMAILIDRCSGSDIVEAARVDAELLKIIPIGSTVQIASGPLEGATGTVKLTHLDRVTVLMAFLGYTRKVTMPAAAVRLAARA